MLPRLLLTALLALALSGCRSIATHAIADALSGPGNLGSDDDPELIGDAAPFGLKTMESVLDSQPEHVGLLTSLAPNSTRRGGLSLKARHRDGVVAGGYRFRSTSSHTWRRPQRRCRCPHSPGPALVDSWAVLSRIRRRAHRTAGRC